MKNISIKLVFVSLIGLIFMVSCEYEIIVPEEIPLDPDVTISFSTEILPIFSVGGCNVASCHGGATQPNLSGGADAVYTSIDVGGFVVENDPDNSTIYTKPDPTSNHYAIYTAEESAKVKQWIQQGALNN